jgi:ParB family transcriptional regulator, chromosome partitioning protein
MLGKGLESLIPPQKGNQNPAPTAGNNQPIDPARELPSRPAEQALPQGVAPAQPAPVQSASPQQPFAQPAAPSAQPAAQPDPRPAPVQRIFSELQKKDEPSVQESIFQIELDKIRPNPDQPRRNFNQEALRELANSIREFGFLQPLVVSKVEKETPTGIGVEYEIIAGERRYMAAKLLGLPRVPAIIRNVSLEREKLELAVIENIQRENLNPIETARAFQRLQEEFRMTQREIAVKLGKSREVVANTMRLLDLPEYIRVAVEKEQMSESHARLLIALDDPGVQKKLFDDILQNKLTTRDVKERVQQFGPRRGRPPLTEENVAPEVRAMQDELSSSLGAPVTIQKGMNTGKITITFYSEEELEEILRKLRNEKRLTSSGEF